VIKSNPFNHNPTSTWLLGQTTFTYCSSFGNVLAFLGTMLLMYLCHKPSIAWPSSLMVIHAYQNVVCVSSSNPALRKIFGIGLDWIGLLKSDYSYLIKYTVLLETLSSDRSSDPYNFKDGSIQWTEVPVRTNHHIDFCHSNRISRINPSLIPQPADANTAVCNQMVSSLGKLPKLFT